MSAADETPEDETPETPDVEAAEDAPVAEAKPKRKRRLGRTKTEEPVAEAAPEVEHEPVQEPAAEAEPEVEDEPAEEPEAEADAEPEEPEAAEPEADEDEPEDDEDEDEDEADDEPVEAKAPAKKPAPAAPRRRPRRDPNLPPPVVRAQAKYVRSSARKARLVCDNIRGKSVDDARAILAHTPRAVARDWSKLLESAVANAEHNHELVGEDLYVKAVTADEGPTIKRFQPRAMGRATKIRKRTAHLTILLTPKD
jgi:ribosomal protein L22